MKAFEYATALSPSTARDLVAGRGAYLAGGNDLLGRLKEYIESPDILINIKSLPGLNQIESGEKSWTIGALVTVAQIEQHPEIRTVFPGLHDAARRNCLRRKSATSPPSAGILPNIPAAGITASAM